MLFEIANVHETWVLMVAIYNVDFELRLTTAVCSPDFKRIRMLKLIYEKSFQTNVT